MLFQVLDVDYTMLDNGPVVRVFGKCETGETVCAFYEGYQPYFYVRGEGAEAAVKNELNVVKVEKVKRFLPTGYRKEPVEFYRVVLKNPAKTPEIRDRLRSKGFQVFEADIPFKYRFMSDFDLHGMEWLEIETVNGVETSTVNAEKKVKIKDVKKVGKEDVATLKYMALDIECVPLKSGDVPDSRKDPIIMISLVFDKPFKGEKSFVLSTRSGEGVLAFEDEKEMLNHLMGVIMNYDPDIITGFNINNFDLPYILERMRQNGIYPSFGRCTKQVVANRVMNRYKINIAGRVIVDSYEIVKKDFSLKRYDLNTVANELLKEKKEPVKYSDIEKFWKGDQKGFDLLVRYSRKDSELAMNLLMKLHLLHKYMALSMISGILLQDVLDSGETTKIENYILREFNKAGFVLPCKPESLEVGRREKLRIKELKGGFVLEPKKGLHSSVLVLDFKSMYPSLIRTYNICPTTLVAGDKEECVESPSGSKFVKESVRKGIIPKILENLMKERQRLKGIMAKESDPEKAMDLNARQWALKLMSNAFYGYFGYSRAKVYNLEVASSITAWGRDTIKKNQGVHRKEFRL